MGQGHHYADTVGAVEYGKVFGNADKSGEIVVGVLNIAVENGKSVKFGAIATCDTGGVPVVSFGNGFCGGCGVGADGNFSLGELFEEYRTLVDGLFVTENFGNVGKGSSVLGEKMMTYLES